jgi:hypothetical protein
MRAADAVHHRRGGPIAVTYPRVGPQLRAYLDRLPAGLDSYPECRAKASLYRGMTDGLTVDASGLAPELVDLLEQPRPVTDWIPEVHSHAILLAQYDQHFDDLEVFGAHSYAYQHRMWSSKLYAFMMRFVSPQRLIASTSQRWAQFHRGSTLQATRTGDDTAEVVLETPPWIYDAILLRSLTEGLRAVLDRSAIPTTLTLLSQEPSTARWSVRWR